MNFDANRLSTEMACCSSRNIQKVRYAKTMPSCKRADPKKAKNVASVEDKPQHPCFREPDLAATPNV
jgi:hypothetical protein